MIVTFTAHAEEQRSYLTRRAATRRTESHAYLIGTRTREGVRIEHVIRPGTPIEEAAMTRPDYGAAATVIPTYLDAGFILLGEWHAHYGLRGPSSGDIATMRAIAEQFPGYLCAITTITDDPRPVTTVHALERGMLVEHTVRVQEYPLLTRDATKDKRVLVLGAGSGLAAAWLQLLKLACKQITVIDDDVIEERNIERHLAAHAALGTPKVEYLASFAKGRTRTRVRTLRMAIGQATERQFVREVRRHDVIYNATGHPLASLRASATARRYERVVLHAGVFARGRGGFVFLDRPGGPCYADAQHFDLRTVGDDRTTAALLRDQYGYTEEELAAQAGAWADTNTVAALQVKVLVEYFKGSALHDLYLIDNEHLTLTHHAVTQREECYCKGR